jgi:phosphoribosyl 1,2-cyclic phosphodiesterase
MTFEQHYSSSKGNLYTVTANNGKRLLVECGVRFKDILKSLNYQIKNVEGCLLSHEHSDHSKSVRDVTDAGITVYSGAGTFKSLGIRSDWAAKAVFDGTLIRFKSFDVLCYSTQHDAAEPLGFVVRCDDEFLLFATDTKNIESDIFGFPYSIVAIECSYSEAELRNNHKEGRIDDERFKRLLDSHMEVRHTEYLLKKCNLSKCKEIHLLHLSRENLDKDKVLTDFKEEFFAQEIIVSER